jgi:hypothetical protein
MSINCVYIFKLFKKGLNIPYCLAKGMKFLKRFLRRIVTGPKKEVKKGTFSGD